MQIMASKTLFVQQFPKYGYEVRTEIVDKPDQSLPPTKERNAYTLPGGAYIGDYKAGQHLCAEMGIAPELIAPEKHICTIGFCETEQKWYGWGNDKLSGFGIGTSAMYKIKSPEQSTTSEDEAVEEIPYRQRPLNHTPTEDAPSTIEVLKTAKTLDDAKAMAIYFAESVA